jgi:hypothetical protein
MFLKPKNSLAIFDPTLRDFLPAEGREVGALSDHGYYWQRRVNDGDVDILDENQAKASVAAADKVRADEAAALEKDRRAALSPEQRAAEDAAAKKKG